MQCKQQGQSGINIEVPNGKQQTRSLICTRTAYATHNTAGQEGALLSAVHVTLQRICSHAPQWERKSLYCLSAPLRA